jgi:hypothetical protein
MSKRGSRQKSADGGGDDRESSGGTKMKVSVCRDPSKLSKSLRQLQKLHGEEFGSLVDEMCISVFSTPDEEIEDAPEDEDEDDKEDRRTRNAEAREINRERKNYRDRLIKIVQQILPSEAIDYIKRHHPEVIRERNLNRYCQLIPTALVAHEDEDRQERIQRRDELRAKNRLWLIKSEHHIGPAFQSMDDLIATANANGVPLTDEEIMYDLKSKLAGDFSDVKSSFEFDMKKFNLASTGMAVNSAQYNTMKRMMIGHIPTTRKDLEIYLRKMPRKTKREDISSYHASFATTQEEVNTLKQEVKRLREETNSSYATTMVAKASKQTKVEGQQKYKDRVCHICKSTGHLKWKCPEQICKVCQKKGHCPNDCPTLKED